MEEQIKTRGTIKDYFDSLADISHKVVLTAEQHAIAELVRENRRLNKMKTDIINVMMETN